MNDKSSKYEDESGNIENNLNNYLKSIEIETKINPILSDLIDISAIRLQYPKYHKSYGKLFFNLDNFKRKIEVIIGSNSISKFRERIADICNLCRENNKILNLTEHSKNLFENLENLANNKQDLNENKKVFLVSKDFLKILVSNYEFNQFKTLKDEYARLKVK